MQQVITRSFQETQKVGEEFASILKGGEVLALYGDLGSGKTTFMQGLAKGLGITRNIISPTFIIMRSYLITDHSGKPKARPESEKKEGSWTSQDDGFSAKNLYHIDLYRIESEKDVEGLGLLELMNQPENIVAIEWPDKIESTLPEKRINIYFDYQGEDKREIRVDQYIQSSSRT